MKRCWDHKSKHWKFKPIIITLYIYCRDIVNAMKSNLTEAGSEVKRARNGKCWLQSRKMKSKDATLTGGPCSFFMSTDCSHWVESQQSVLRDLITWVANLQCDYKNNLLLPTPTITKGKGQRRWRDARLIEGLWDISCLRPKAHIHF